MLTPGPFPAGLRVAVPENFLPRRKIAVAALIAGYWVVFVTAYLPPHSLFRHVQSFWYTLGICTIPLIVIAVQSFRHSSQPLYYHAAGAGLWAGTAAGAQITFRMGRRYVLPWQRLSKGNLVESIWCGLPCLMLIQDTWLGARVHCVLPVATAGDRDRLRAALEDWARFAAWKVAHRDEFLTNA